MRKSVLNSLLLAGLIGLLSTAAHADVANDAQRQAIEAQRLAGMKQVRQQMLEAKLNLLQQERACVQVAMSIESLHTCDQMSQQMMERMQAQQKAMRESLQGDRQPAQ